MEINNKEQKEVSRETSEEFRNELFHVKLISIYNEIL